MQSFRERSGFQGNQHCYQQEPRELSRLENYRHHLGQTGQGYETHSLSAAGMPTAGTASKDCYGQQSYPSYGSTSTQTKKPYRGGKPPTQHVPSGFSGHVSSGYTSHYMSEGHLQQKWDESAQMSHSQYEQDMVGHLEPRSSGSSQYIEQNMLGISQSQCHLPSQPSAPTYTNPHQQGHRPNPTISPLMYPQSHVHFPQHSRPSSSTSTNYMEKGNSIPHTYKSGYGMPPNVQYSRQMGNTSALKPSGYRTQNNYGYQQPASRTGFEQQGSMQGITSTPESHPKFQHYNQSQQSYCITDISVRSPEQYYQNCSPSSSHSPARSVGRSPSYSSTPSPLMPNPESFQYGQPINPASSSSSAGVQDPNMLIPAHTQSPSSINQHSQSYSSSLKERFSEKLFSNPSLWSLNALTSQVENISNNVQQLLLSEALIANKKNGKRNLPKKGEDYRGQIKSMEESSCPDSQQGSLTNDTFGTPRSLSSVVQEGGYSSSTEDQMEQNYYYFGQGKCPTQASAHSQLSLDTVSTCSVNSADSERSLRSTTSEGHPNSDPVQKVPMQMTEEQKSSLRSLREETSPISVTATSPVKHESNSLLGINQLEITEKEHLQKSIWTERINDEKKIGMINVPTDESENECKRGDLEETKKHQEWPEDEKFPSHIQKMNKSLTNERYSYETGDTIYQNLESKYDVEDQDFSRKDFLDVSSKENESEVEEAKSEVLKLESQLTIEGLTPSPAFSRDALTSNQISPEKTEDSEDYLTPQSEFSEEKLSTTEKQEFFDKQQFVLSNSPIEVSEKGGLPPTHGVVNNTAKQEETFTESCDKNKDKVGVLLVKTDAGETTVQDISYRGNRRGSAPCDIAPPSHSVKMGFSAFNENATLQTQARDCIDAKVLEPDSPQLPGKSIMHSAPSWANTPPSPQKGDDEIEPGISCPSAVTPTMKAEPLTPSAHPRLLGRKHTRGRRRLIHANAAIGSVERDVVQSFPQKPDMPSSNSALFSEQMGAVQPDSSQTPKLADVLPSRMCTRSLGSQSSLKVCTQDRRKPVAKPSSKPDPKVVPKPGSKPGLKLNVKNDLRPNTKSAPKSSSKPGTKPSLRTGTKQGSKLGPKQGHKAGQISSVKPGLKPGPKTAPVPALKSSPKIGLRPNEKVTPKGPGRPRSLNRTKYLKYKVNTHSEIENINGTICISETTTQQENATSLLETILDTTLCSTIDNTAGSPLDTKIDASFVNSEAKDQKSMVLRSRKQTPGKLSEQKEKKKETLVETSAIGLTETHMQEIAVAQPVHEYICADSISLPNETIVSIPNKRKCGIQGKGSVNKKKYQKSSQQVQQPLLQEQINTVVDSRGTKGRRKQRLNLEPSICSTMMKESLATEDNNDTSGLPLQGPTKTKYLPPRKGRGLKYEAMVQKITSPTNKKQPLPFQSDGTQDELTLKPALEYHLTEKSKSINTTIMGPEEAENPVKLEETPEALGIQTPLKKRRKWATIEITDIPDTALEAKSLIINTPRLAKQKAIKNNHEMHLKQQKKRKCTEITGESQEQTVLDIPGLDIPIPTLAEPSLPLLLPLAEPDQLSVQLCSKRGRRPSNKKKKEEAVGQYAVKRQRIQKKSGLKTIQQNINVIMNTENESEPKTRCKGEFNPTVKGRLSDIFQPQDSDIKQSFKPYVHIDSSRRMASFCTIVNRPEEEHLLIVKKAKRKNLVRIKNEATLAKATPNSSVMLQGPIVNKSLTDKYLVCCLCGKPANYRELGDLCGPYYPEDTMPRKTLSVQYQEDFRQNYDKQPDKTTVCTTEQTDILSEMDTKDSPKEESSKADRKPITKERRSQLRTRLGLHMKFKRLQLLQGRAVEGASSAGEEDCYHALQRLQLEAEGNEHWAHVSCAVWTSGVILITGKLYGLKEAAQESAHMKCSICQNEQASVSCSWKNCTHKYHYVCAKETGCIFDEETFTIKCPTHQAI